MVLCQQFVSSLCGFSELSALSSVYHSFLITINLTNLCLQGEIPLSPQDGVVGASSLNGVYMCVYSHADGKTTGVSRKQHPPQMNRSVS